MTLESWELAEKRFL